MKPKLLFLVTEDLYFCSHRLALARAALAAGYDVGVITQVTAHGDIIRQAGLKLFPLPFARSGRKPLQDLATLSSLLRIYRRERPDLVHHVSIKPILYGSMAAAICGVPRVINAYTGLGFTFTSNRPLARVVRAAMRSLLRPWLAGRRTWTIVQNPDDRALLRSAGLIDDARTSLVRGSGVDTTQFRPAPEPEGIPVVLFAARLLWDKGVGEFVEAAGKLHAAGIAARFVLVGEPDPENPMSVPVAKLEQWRQQGVIELWGRRDDMVDVFRQATIVCLPSWREGLPKVLIEAAACGRPIVTADAPGCREIVRHGESGLLVPPKDAGALAAAIRRLLDDADCRRRMGQCGRAVAEAEFAIERVVTDTLELYRRLLGCGSPATLKTNGGRQSL